MNEINLQIKHLRFKPGDLLIARVGSDSPRADPKNPAYDPFFMESMLAAVCSEVANALQECGADVDLLVVGNNVEIEQVDEDRMNTAGWYKKEI